MNARREYRVVEETRGDETFSFRVEYRNNPNAMWTYVNSRDTLDMAMECIATMKGQMVISKRVVYAE